MARPYAVDGARAEEQIDPRVSAVLEVLGGRPVNDTAAAWNVEPALLHRWVRAFVDAGTAQVTNRPAADVAMQRDRFLAAFAHEVRTPLTVAQGWTTMLAGGLLPPERVATSVDRLGAALDRLVERTLDVELMAAASLGRLNLTPRTVRTVDLLEEVAGLLDDCADVHGGELLLTVDPAMFRRVLRDLWDAAGGDPEPQERRVAVTAVPTGVEVRVQRVGDPIDPTVLRALFEPFDLNDDATGVTIGLYLARALTVAHGGTLGVEQDDCGATFWVRIPTQALPDQEER